MTNDIRSLRAIALGVLASGVVTTATAHTVSGTLGDAASATDVYQAICFDDETGPPQSLVAQVLDKADVQTPVVSVTIRRGTAGNGIAATSTDRIDADANYSRLIWVNGGAGTYDVYVGKDGPGAESYDLIYHCLTGRSGEGKHTGTDLGVRQNQ